MLQRIGQYEIRGELGKGGFGRVYLAFDPRVGRQVAVKVLETGDDANVISRFRTEAIAAGNLRHKNIVTVFEFGEDKGKQFLVMEYLDGEDLHGVITNRRPLSLLDKMEVMSQVADGLQHAHQNGVVHRDVKPANIMLLSDGSVKIMDFGIARLVRENAARLTQSGYLVGTVSYMAPEQFGGAEVDALGDVWAYGVIYYELLTGQHPFQVADTAATMFRITSQDPTSVRSLYPECPDVLENVISRLLAKDREKRYQSFEDVQFDVAPILTSLQKVRAAELVTRVRELLKEHKVEEADTAVRQILTLDPANREGRELRSAVQEEKRKRPRVEALLKKADTETAKRNFAEAIVALDAACKLSPSDQSIQLRLEKLRNAKEQADRAARLIDQAQKQLEAQNLTGAFKDLSQALQVDPQNTEGLRLLDRTKRDMDTREREQRLRDGLGRARGLLMINAFDEAAQLLKELEADYGSSPPVAQMLEELRRQKQEVETRERLQTQIAQCKDLLKRGELNQVVDRLEKLARDFPDDRQVSSLLSYAKDELAARERNWRIEEIGREAWALTKTSEYDRALQLVENGLQQYPGEEKLGRLLQTILAGKAEFETARLLNRETERCAQMRKAGRLEEAAALADSLIAEHGATPALTALRDQIRNEIQAREIELRERQKRAAFDKDMAEAKRLLDQRQYDPAIPLLQRIASEHPEDGAPRKLLERAKTDAEKQRQEAEKQKQEALKQNDIQNILNQSAERERAGDLDGALTALDQGLQKHGVVWQLADAFGKIQVQKNVKEEARRIQERAAAQDWTAALTLIDAAQKKHAGHTVFQSLFEQVQADRRAAIDSACAGVERHLAKLDFVRARDAIAKTKQAHGDDPRIASLEAELNATEFRHQRMQAAQNLLRQRDWQRAETAVREVLDKNGADTEALDLLSEIGKQRDQAQRKQLYEKTRAETERLIAAENFDSAIAALEKLLAQFPNDRVIEDDLVAARAAKAAKVRLERQQVYDRGRAEAERLIREENYDSATDALKKLLVQFPNDGVLVADLKDAGVRKAAREREEGRAAAARLIAEENFEAGIGALKNLLAKFPKDGLLEDDLRKAITDKEARERQRRWEIYTGGREEAARLLREDNFDAAIGALQKLLAQFPRDGVLEEDLRTAQAAQKAAEQSVIRRLHESGREDAARLLRQDRFDEAIAVLENLVAQFPGESALEADLNSAKQKKSAREALQQRQLYEKGRAAVERLVREMKFDAAIAALQQMLVQFPADALLLEDLRRAEAAKDEQRQRQIKQQGRSEAERLLREQKFDAAIQAIERLLTQVPNDPVLEEDLRSARAAKERHEQRLAYEQGRGEADRLVRSREFDAAISRLQAMLQQFPGDPLFEQMLDAARKAQETHERNKLIARGREEAQRLVKERNFDAAIRGLQNLLQKFPGDPGLEEELQSVSSGKALLEQRLKDDELVAKLEKLYTKTDTHRVKEIAVKRLAEGEEPRVREWLERAERLSETLETPIPEPQRGKTWPVSVGLVVVVGGLAAFVYTITHPTPKIELKPERITFTYRTGQSLPPPQPISVTASDSWQFKASDDWIGASQSSSGKQLMVSVDPSHLSAGQYSGWLRVNLEGGRAGRELPVKLTVEGTSNGISLDPSELSFASSAENPQPQTKIVSVNPRDRWKLTGSHEKWISAAEQGGKLQVGVNPGGLKTGTYTGLVGVSTNDGGAQTQLIVKLVVGKPTGEVSLNPSELHFAFSPGQPPPGPQTASVTASGRWKVTASDSWISAIPQGSKLQVAVNPSGRHPGSNSGTVSVSLEDGSASAVLRLTLSVEPAALALNVDPAAIAFPPYTKGASPPSARTVTIGPGRWKAATNADWITLAPPTGDASTKLQVSLHPGRLAVGPQTATLNISTDDGRASKSVAVTLNVQNPPLPEPVDCHAPTYLGLQGATITWSGELAPGAVVTLGRNGVYEGGGTTKGTSLPGCDVSSRVLSPNGVTIEEAPSPANKYAILRLRNKSGVPISTIAVRWDVK